MENKEIKQNRYGIEYTKQGDYYMPNLVLEKEKITLNKYGRARLNYLKTNKKAEYMIMFTKGTRNSRKKIRFYDKRVSKKRKYNRRIKIKKSISMGNSNEFY